MTVGKKADRIDELEGALHAMRKRALNAEDWRRNHRCQQPPPSLFDRARDAIAGYLDDLNKAVGG